MDWLKHLNDERMLRVVSALTAVAALVKAFCPPNTVAHRLADHVLAFEHESPPPPKTEGA